MPQIIEVQLVFGLCAILLRNPAGRCFSWAFSDDEEEADDFIGVEQAKELLTDIIQRMDIMDMVHFDRWLKTMTIARDSFSG